LPWLLRDSYVPWLMRGGRYGMLRTRPNAEKTLQQVMLMGAALGSGLILIGLGTVVAELVT
ncbi:MAG: hypothetical protein ACRDHF_11700, partial [Tepidiformaceae bacterium]